MSTRRSVRHLSGAAWAPVLPAETATSRSGATP